MFFPRPPHHSPFLKKGDIYRGLGGGTNTLDTNTFYFPLPSEFAGIIHVTVKFNHWLNFFLLLGKGNAYKEKLNSTRDGIG